MTTLVKNITSEAAYQVLLSSADPQKLVVVDFTASWCQPCQMMKPVFAALSTQYRHVTFAQVDVDHVKPVAQTAGVTAMPTFQFFKGGAKVTELKGANKAGLEELVKQYQGPAEEGAGGVGGTSGHSDLTEHITVGQLECLNQVPAHSIRNLFTSDATYLESDADEQLIFSIPFNETVKLHSIKIVPGDDINKAPKTIKTYVNRVAIIGFDDADSEPCTETIELTKEDYEKGAIIPLRFVKYQSVHNLNIFVQDNLGDEESTVIRQFVLYGTPVATTKMSDLKKNEHDH
ncbi:PITH domain-containing protein [Phlyctochytrium arcticum]|nr:PITH domain-containing protein [Phlyctochytrium arcticum]